VKSRVTGVEGGLKQLYASASDRSRLHTFHQDYFTPMGELVVAKQSIFSPNLTAYSF
jgi:hypothetical protein